MTKSEEVDRLPEDIERAIYEICLDGAASSREGALSELKRLHPRLEGRIAVLVDQLLHGERLLEQVDLDGVSGAEPVAETPRTVGPYSVIRLLGQGGFGVVVLARQTEPIARDVAIKLLIPGSATRQRLQRFESERQILAELSHPGIAQVFDAGIANGRPYFAMEYVPGEPLNRFCDQNQLDVMARLRLFQSVCLAVQHAHERGIIHRDLKPQNVLAFVVDGRPHAKVIDFGIAKILDRVDHSGTRAGEMIGSPLYMSPEQARGDTLATDTRSDVYSLGVILFELLTGAVPLEVSRDEKLTPERVRDAHESPPPRPSSRIHGADSESSAANRGVSSPRLKRMLRGDLDAIALTALHPDRERRYRSPRDLADDLDRFLRREVVEARPPTLGYRAQRYLQRNRWPLLVGATVAVLLLVGTVTSVGFANEAEANLQQFNQLALVQRMDEAERDLADILPPWPSRIPDLERWQRSFGEPLTAALPKLVRSRDDLRQRALPYTKADRELDLAASERTRLIRLRRERLEYLDTMLAADLPVPSPAAVRAQLEEDRQNTVARLREAEARTLVRARYRFERPRDQFLHDTLTDLVDRLDRFVHGRGGACTKCQNRIDRARELQARIEGPDAHAWADVAAAVAADPRFEGVELKPQPGLIPLGSDPATGLQEFWHWDSARRGSSIKRTAAGGIEVVGEMGLVLVLIPGGDSLVGAQADEPEAPGYDPGSAFQARPTSTVSLEPYFLSKFEATKGQWMRLGGGRPSIRRKGEVHGTEIIDDRYPVENISWRSADEVLSRWGLAIPTEAQWEHACRASTTSPWPTGAEPESLQGHANLADRSALASNAAFPCDDFLTDGHSLYAPVGAFSPNGFGLHDMIGNVGEWCADSHVSFAYLVPARAGDGLRQAPLGSARSVRAHSYSTRSNQARSSERSGATETLQLLHVGVRPCRSLNR